MHNTHINMHPNIACTLKHMYLLCKPAGVGGEEALNAWCGWMALTDLHRQGKERELARKWEHMGEGEWCGKSYRIYVCLLCAGSDPKWHYNVSVALWGLLSNCPVAASCTVHIMVSLCVGCMCWLCGLSAALYMVCVDIGIIARSLLCLLCL